MDSARKAEIRARLAGALPWDVNRLRWLLRFGRKNDGPWNDVITDGLFLPDDEDAERLAAAPTDIADLLAEVERLTALVEKATERQKYWRYVFDLLTGNIGGKNVGQVISDHLDWLEP